MAKSDRKPAGPAIETAAFRQFNRMYTRFIGVLGENLLQSEFSLAEARVLYELANRERPAAKEIAEALGMDAGYLSRILARFEEKALLERKTSKRDNRSARLTLTKGGRAAFKTLNQLSERQAKDILAKLPPTARAELLRSMHSVERILSQRDEKPAVVLRPHRPGDIGWVIHREAAVYAEEYGFDASFEALVAKIGFEFLTHFNPKRERCWIAEVNGHNAGHIFLVEHPDEPKTAKLRLLLVESSARGTGLGTTLVNECIAFARLAGYRKIVLWTQSTLLAAHHIYKKAGFRLVKEEPHHSFGQDLIGQTWELDLKK